MDQMTAVKPAADAALPYVLLDQHQLDLTVVDTSQLKLSFAPSVWDAELFLVVDLYSAANPVHPAGHVGWWKWPLEIKGDLTIELSRSADGFNVTFDGAAPDESWKNPDFLGTDEPVIAMHAVLRPVLSEAVRFDDIVYVYNSPAALRSAEEHQAALDFPTAASPSAPWYLWPRHSKVHLVSMNIFDRDAVGNFTFSLHRLLRSNGVPCQLYASNFDPLLRGTIRHTCELFSAAAPEDLIFVNFSIFDPWLPRLVDLPSRKILYFHNITPPRFLQVYDAEYADHCADGIAQLKHLERFDLLMANSISSARVLQSVAAKNHAGHPPGDAQLMHVPGPFGEASRLLQKAVFTLEAQSQAPLEVATTPPMIGIKAWDEIAAQPVDLPAQGTKLLYVGRIAPHKRIEDLFALFDHYHKLNSDSSLVIVGGSGFDGYAGFLRYLLNNEYADIKQHIHFQDGISDGQLKTVYQRSSALVTMSEHEGFCVPVVEAMVFDKPVFAYANEAVAETLGRSGRVFFSKDFEAVAADIHSVLTTPWIERLILDAQQQRLKQLIEQASGIGLWAALEKVIYRARAV